MSVFICCIAYGGWKSWSLPVSGTGAEVDDTQMFDYSLFFINTLWDYFRETGDRTTLEELWPTVLKQIEIAKKSLDGEMLVKDSDILGWCFVDWNLNLNKQASAQGILLYALSAAVKMAQTIGDILVEEELAELYCACRNAANERLWDSKQGCYISRKRQTDFDCFTGMDGSWRSGHRRGRAKTS